MTKLIIAIIRDNDANAVVEALVAGEFRVTRIASTGGFFRQGNTTLMIGVSEARLELALDVVRKACGPAPADGSRRATVFVLNTNRYEQL